MLCRVCRGTRQSNRRMQPSRHPTSRSGACKGDGRTFCEMMGTRKDNRRGHTYCLREPDTQAVAAVGVELLRLARAKAHEGR